MMGAADRCGASPAATLVIAEAGVNHGGDEAVAVALVRAAKACGADVVKFQHFRASTIVADGTRALAYQSAGTGVADQSALLRSLELDLASFDRIAKACRDEGVEFLCTPFEPESAADLVALGMRRIKIPSGELTNLPMLRAYARFGLPVLLSTGMGTLQEVRLAAETLSEAGAGEVTVLHCTSLYPAPPAALNLRAMATMADALRRPVGYSDHSLDDHAAIAAVALGARVVEKHFTLDRTLPGPDHKASLEPQAFATMVRRIREVEAMLGDGIKRPAPGETEVAALVRRSWHAARALEAGCIVEPSDVRLMRPAAGLPPAATPVGRRLARTVSAGAPIAAEDLAP